MVIRPDSGDAIDNILYALSELEKAYGSSVNAKGYKILERVALIQGDGVSLSLAKSILSAMKKWVFR